MPRVISWLEKVPWARRSLVGTVGEKWHGFPALVAAALVTFAYTVGVPTGEGGGVQASTASSPSPHSSQSSKRLCAPDPLSQASRTLQAAVGSGACVRNLLSCITPAQLSLPA